MIGNNNSVAKDTAVGPDFGDFIACDTLTEILRAGAQKMLKAAIEKEVADNINDRADIVDVNGRRLVVLHGAFVRMPKIVV